MESQQRAWLSLIRAPGIGAATGNKLLAVHGSAAQLLQAGAAEWRKLGIAKPAQQWLSQPDEALLDADLAWLSQANHHLITIDQPLYPQVLRELSNAPLGLFVIGNPELLTAPQLAIVGTRNPSPTGKKTAQEFAAHLADAGLSITSGLALGIDAAAHTGALKADGHTLAICATGLDRVYPARHRDLARQITEQGALISEFPLGTAPMPALFPRRNRIISGLSQGTLVVEAAPRSGSLITARLAAEQGREVFAIPGSIHNPQARGCHQLIRQGAKLVETAEHILEELGPQFAQAAAAWRQLHVPDSHSNAKTTVGEENTEDDTEIDRLLTAMGYEPVSVDELAERTELTTEALSAMLLNLELDGKLHSLPAGRYQRA